MIMEEIYSIISLLMSADEELIQKGTIDLNEAYNKKETIPALFQLILTGKQKEVRQYAAVLLYKRLGKKRYWCLLEEDQKLIIKEALQNCIIEEKETLVLTAFARLISAIINHEDESISTSLADNLFRRITTDFDADDIHRRERASIFFSSFAEVATEQFLLHLDPACSLYLKALTCTDFKNAINHPIIINYISGMTFVIPNVLGCNEAEHNCQNSIPLIARALIEFSKMQKPDVINRCFELLEAIAKFIPRILMSRTKCLLDTCLVLAKDARLEDKLRARAVLYLGWLVTLNNSNMVKHKWFASIVEFAFDLFSIEQFTPSDKDYIPLEDVTQMVGAGMKVIQQIAEYIHSETLINCILSLTKKPITDTLILKTLERRAIYLIIGLISDGCSDVLATTHFDRMMFIIKIGLKDPEPCVKYTAYYALSQYSVHLQPKISKHAEELLSIVVASIQEHCNEKRNTQKDDIHIKRQLMAIEAFWDNAKKPVLEKFLPQLFEELLEIISAKYSRNTCEYALDTLATIARASKDNIKPFCEKIVKCLRPYMLVNSDDEDLISLRPHAIDAISAFFEVVNDENLKSISTDALNLTINLLENDCDAETRRALFQLIGQLSLTIKEDIGDVLPKLMSHIYLSILSLEDDSNEQNKTDINDNHGDGLKHIMNDSDDESDEIKISQKNQDTIHIFEKIAGMLCLKDLCHNCKMAFKPYLIQSYETILKITDHQHKDVRKMAVNALPTIIENMFDENDINKIIKANNEAFPKLCKIIENETHPEIVLESFKSLKLIMDEQGEYIVRNKQLTDDVFKCIYDAWKGTLICMAQDDLDIVTCIKDSDDDDDEDDEGDPSDTDQIVEAAGLLMISLSNSIDSDAFCELFGKLYPIIIDKLEKHKTMENFNNERASAYIMFSRCFDPLKNNSTSLFKPMLSSMLMGLKDKCIEVRLNAAYGLGELVLTAQEKSFSAYPNIINALYKAITTEEDDGVLDNICGAIARIIFTNSNLVPLNKALKVFVQKLPLRTDFEENYWILKCFRFLYCHKRDKLQPHVDEIIKYIVDLLVSKNYESGEVEEMAKTLISELFKDHPQKYANAVKFSDENTRSFLSTINFDD